MGLFSAASPVEPVAPAGAGIVSLPLLGSVAAGAPIEAIEVAETVDVPRELVSRNGDSFVLRVAGDSMIEDQICDGDLVVIESRAEARDGETVVALVRQTFEKKPKLVDINIQALERGYQTAQQQK